LRCKREAVYERRQLAFCLTLETPERAGLSIVWGLIYPHVVINHLLCIQSGVSIARVCLGSVSGLLGRVSASAWLSSRGDHEAKGILIKASTALAIVGQIDVGVHTGNRGSIWCRVPPTPQRSPHSNPGTRKVNCAGSASLHNTCSLPVDGYNVMRHILGMDRSVAAPRMAHTRLPSALPR
jgi:hypothetical protein